MSGREALTAPCPVHPACGCAPASPLPCTCPPLTPGLRERIEAAAAREALAEVERLGLAIDAALVHLDHEHVGFARQTLVRAQRGGEG